MPRAGTNSSKFPDHHRVRGGILVAFAALLAVAVGSAVGSRRDAAEPAPATAAARPAAAQDAHDACHEYVTDRQRDAAAAMIRRAGYDCRNVAGMCPYLLSEGFTVWCNDYRYEYAIENHGGRWAVKSP